MQTLAIALAKGGVGKTTLAVHLAVGLARSRKRVLLVDLDPQGNATEWLIGVQEEPGTVDVLLGGRRPRPEELREVPQEPNLYMLPATPELLNADLRLSAVVAREGNLRQALKGLPFDFVLLDCPPNLGASVLNALCAADFYLAPVVPAHLSLTGLARLEEMAAELRQKTRAHAKGLGFLLFAADSRNRITEECREVLRREEPGKLWPVEVRVSTVQRELSAQRRTAWDKGADSRGAEDYPAVLSELYKRLKKEKR